MLRDKCRSRPGQITDKELYYVMFKHPNRKCANFARTQIIFIDRCHPRKSAAHPLLPARGRDPIVC